MRGSLVVALLTLALAPAAAWAKDDDGSKWRDKREEKYWKEREKAQKEWFKHQEKRQEHERKQWEHYWKEQEKHSPRRYGYYRDDRYGYRAVPPPPRPWYDEGQRYYVPRRHRDDDDDDDDFDAIYTPWGYYEDYPKVPYDARRPRPRGQGQIGPYRFEIWK
jgi:hypothetical protein